MQNIYNQINQIIALNENSVMQILKSQLSQENTGIIKPCDKSENFITEKENMKQFQINYFANILSNPIKELGHILTEGSEEIPEITRTKKKRH